MAGISEQMRKTILGTGMATALLLLSTPALAQMGGGMGGMGGGMGGGGMGGGSMGGSGGMGRGHRDGMDEDSDASRRMGGRPRMAEMKPIKREKLDKPVQAMFAAADSNRDGIVTLDELKAVLVARRDATIRTRFEKIDTNRDGKIDQAEFIAWQSSMGSVAASDDEATGDRGGPVAESIAPVLPNDEEGRVLRRIIEPLSPTVIATANTNYDKGLSLDELLTYERKRFDDADTDKDGELSGEELRAFLPKGRRGPGGPDGGMAPPPSPGQ
ncbi:MAG TPA: EF-hand domain-containing protein [Sphingobium sp.]|uniref:EF-hand domain-containing protein n=1 Tax=Sphingobium sp. TaxID=1912891 RepID=UPI002ED2498C